MIVLKVVTLTMGWIRTEPNPNIYWLEFSLNLKWDDRNLVQVCQIKV